ncbi:MAG: hypothetical protein PWP71_2456 [Clostridia bacterium]|nr:hypothetical protein [Clostridia bacterium]
MRGLLRKGSIVKFEGHFVKVTGFKLDDYCRLCAILETKDGLVGHVPRSDIVWNGKQFVYQPLVKA